MLTKDEQICVVHGWEQIGTSNLAQTWALPTCIGPICTAVLAENAHPFEDPLLRMDSPSGLFELTGSFLGG